MFTHIRNIEPFSIPDPADPDNTINFSKWILFEIVDQYDDVITLKVAGKDIPCNIRITPEYLKKYFGIDFETQWVIDIVAFGSTLVQYGESVATEFKKKVEDTTKFIAGETEWIAFKNWTKQVEFAFEKRISFYPTAPPRRWRVYIPPTDDHDKTVSVLIDIKKKSDAV